MQDIDWTKYSCLNLNYNFEITNVLLTITGQVRGFEGEVLANGMKQGMIWDPNGQAMSNDRGFDLVQREDLKKLNNE